MGKSQHAGFLLLCWVAGPAVCAGFLQQCVLDSCCCAGLAVCVSTVLPKSTLSLPWGNRTLPSVTSALGQGTQSTGDLEVLKDRRMLGKEREEQNRTVRW